MKLGIPVKDNAKLEEIEEAIDDNSELEGYLESANVNAVKRLQYSDHGSTHVKIVSNAALKILRILMKRGVKPSVVKGHEFSEEDAEVVVVLASAFHDIGMIVHRKDHDLMGVLIAQKFVEDILEEIYEGKEKAIMVSEVLSAMYPHDVRGKPFTVEAGIVSVADSLDMAEGRARIPFEAGGKDIHSVYAMAIKNVKISEGEEDEEPVQIKIDMSNSAGIFQIDELLKKKVQTSGIQEYFKIVVEIESEEEKILKEFEL